MGNASLRLLFLALGFASAIGGSMEGIDSAVFSHSGSSMRAESGVVWPQTEPACNGLIGECYSEEEMLTDSETNRRILYSKTYISYDALKKDSVPCNQKGAPYYNCHSGGMANPYSRGCLKITHCERNTS